MSLLKKIFGHETAAAPAAMLSTQFHESHASSESGSVSAPRRELVQLVLRDTMRRHGIPSNWIDSRILSVMTGTAMTGMHVHFIVRHGHDRLLVYVPAFQSSFMQAIETFEPRVSDWLYSLSWQFEGMGAQSHPAMPEPDQWAAGAATATGPVNAQSGPDTGKTEDDEVAEDLKALLAIRDADLAPNPAARSGKTL